MQDIIHRKVELSEAEALARLIAGFRDHLEARVPTDDEILRRLPRALADPAIEFTCAWRADEAVGYTQTRFLTSVWAGGLEAYLEDLFVVSSARGCSVGRGLLRHVVARAEERQASRLGLNTNNGNVPAQSLYRSEGFSPKTHDLYPDGQEVVWSLDLAGRMASQ